MHGVSSLCIFSGMWLIFCRWPDSQGSTFDVVFYSASVYSKHAPAAFFRQPSPSGKTVCTATVRSQAFSVVGPVLRNGLPEWVQKALSLTVFRKLFQRGNLVEDKLIWHIRLSFFNLSILNLFAVFIWPMVCCIFGLLVSHLESKGIQ